MNDAALTTILEEAKTIAILGLHDDPAKAARYVPEYLAKQGYTVLGVNPKLAGQLRFGAAVAASVTALDQPVDVLDIFRATPAAHLDEILAMTPLPRVVWLQLGIRDDGFAEALRAAGITVVQNRCTLADHRRLGIAAKSAAP